MKTILIALLMVVFAHGASAEACLQLRLTLELTDGSRLVGIPNMESVPVQTSYAKMDVPLRHILTIKMDADHETASLDLKNGDKIKGVISLSPIQLETVFGKASISIEHIRELRVMLSGDALPAGEGPLSFGGVKWTPWRTEFAVQGDKLVSLPKVCPRFSYGHDGNGRGPTLVSNIGSAAWKDYSMEFEFCMSGVDPALNPYGLPPTHRAGYVMFHVADARESWNERGNSLYTLGLSGDGTWTLSCLYNGQCTVPCGYGSPTQDAGRVLAQGKGLKLDPQGGNKFRIDVRGTRIQVWADGGMIADVRDEKMSEPIGGQTLDHGGIGFGTPWECMIWVRNFSVKSL